MSINARDIAQRSIGCIGFSALAHSTLLVALLLAPKSATDLDSASASKHKLSEGDGSVEVIASQNPAPAPAAAAPAPVEKNETASLPPQPEPKVQEELPPPPPKKTAEVAPAKPVKTKVLVKAPSAPKIKTTQSSDVVAEAKDKNVELENLSPVIAEEPMQPSSDDAEVVSAPTTTAPATTTEEKEAKETSDITPAAAPTAKEATPEPQAATEPKEEAPKNAATSEEGTGRGGLGTSTSAAAPTGSGTADSPSGDGAASSAAGTGGGKVIEASLRKPLPGNQLPVYPRQDRLMRREGTSIVIGDVRHDGAVENVRLERSSGSKDMDLAAIAAFKKWKFAPGAEATVRKSFQYALQGPEQVSYTGLKR